MCNSVVRWEVDTLSDGMHCMRPVTCSEVTLRLEQRVMELEELLALGVRGVQKESKAGADNETDVVLGTPAADKTKGKK